MSTPQTRPEIFDAACMLGRSRDHQPGAPSTVAELRAVMAEHGIDAALVYHADAVWYGVREGNQRLLEEIVDAPALVPCWVVMPEQTDEAPPAEEIVSEMMRRGVRAARLFPNDHRIALRVWHVGRLLSALARHAIPLFIDFGHTSWSQETIDWDGLIEICSAYPKLPVVLVRPHIGSDRRLYAAMDACANLYAETSYYTVHRGIEGLVRRFGEERVLFGSGMPWRAPGPALTALAYSLISNAGRALVAGGNLRRLLAEVQP